MDVNEKSGITQNCGYCHTDNEGFVRLPLEKHAHAYIWRSSVGKYGIELRAGGWVGRVEINFCPMCGRRLSND